MKTSGSSATLKVGKLTSNIYRTWQKPKEFTKSQEKKILLWTAKSPFLFTSFQVRKLWVRVGHSSYDRQCPAPWGPVSISASGTHTCNPAPSSTNLSLHGRRVWGESGLSLYPSLLSKGTCLKTPEEGWVLTSTQRCQPAADNGSSACLGAHQRRSNHATREIYGRWRERCPASSHLLHWNVSSSAVNTHQ